MENNKNSTSKYKIFGLYNFGKIIHINIETIYLWNIILKILVSQITILQKYLLIISLHALPHLNSIAWF